MDHALPAALPFWAEDMSPALAGASRIVVCGIGNDLRGDDAAGPLCLRAMRKRHPKAEEGPRPVRWIDGGETPENETSFIRAFHPDVVILIDAARAGKPPGEVTLIQKEAIADEEVSTHRISLALLVRFIEESIGARVVFIGIEPESTNQGDPISAPVRKAMREVEDVLSRMIFEDR